MIKYEYTIIDRTAYDFNGTAKSFIFECEYNHNSFDELLEKIKTHFNAYMHKVSCIHATTDKTEKFANDSVLRYTNEKLLNNF